MTTYYADKTVADGQQELYWYLDANGPATKGQIANALGWRLTKAATVIGSQPEWLVVVGVHKVGFSKQVLLHCRGEHTLPWCQECGRKIFNPTYAKAGVCNSCAVRRRQEKADAGEDVAAGYPFDVLENIDPHKPYQHRPGSDEKALVLAARYHHGVPLWDERDNDGNT